MICDLCGFKAIHRCQIDLDHIDGNHDNDNKENLQRLCANCHRLKTFLNKDWVVKNTSTYKTGGSMKKLFLVLALLILGSFVSQGAFAATAAPNTYPACYHGYGVGDPLYNGTNGDQLTEPGWCIDGYGVLQPNNIMTKSSSQPVTQGGFAVPIINNNYSTTLNATANPTTFDALIPQQTGSYIVDYGAERYLQ